MAGAASVIASGALCATSSACRANRPSCGYEFAIISRAASPYDCQATVAATPMQRVIRKRTSASKDRLTHELAGNESAENSDCVVLGRALISTSLSCAQWRRGLGLFTSQVPNRDLLVKWWMAQCGRGWLNAPKPTTCRSPRELAPAPTG